VAAVIELRLRDKRFAPVGEPVLTDLELTLGAGEFVALLGPSGSGKTTILRLLAGLDQAFDGERVTGTAAPRLGYLFQEARLMPWLTALENVAIVVGGDRNAAAEALTAVALEEALDQYPHQLSGGMQRRVALARAIAYRPELLLLDEPFVSLDRPNALQLQSLLLDYWQRERPTVVLVSHDLDEALVLADRMLFLGGRPASVVLDEAVGLERPREPSSMSFSTRRRQLLEAHPRLLSGAIGLPA
jgi:NitT/TauT family transport system ATP-binding protein